MGLKGLDFNDDLEMLFKAVLELKNIDECYKFLRILLQLQN